jgi:hypothetical protein
MIHIKEKLVQFWKDEAPRVKDRGHTCFIGDIPFHPELKKFFLEFHHKNKNAIAVVDRYPSTDGSYHAINIAFDHAIDLLAGRLCVEKDDASDAPIYAVEADSIHNPRYKDTNKNYNIKKSKDFKKASKLARQHIKAFDFLQVQNTNRYAFLSAQGDINQKGRSKLASTFRIEVSDMLQEVKAMTLAGYTPSTAAFSNAMAFINEEGAEAQRAATYKPRKAFVWLMPTCAVYKYDGDVEPQTAHTVEELPEEIRNKIAVLNIGEKNSPIIDVGVKVDDTKYWVFMS